MCGEDYFYRDWPSPPPSGDGEFEDPSILDDLFDGDDLPDFGDPEADGDDWDDEGWFAGEDEDWVDELEDVFLTLEDAIMLMDEDELLEWLTMDEEGQPYRSSCGETALLDWEEAA